MQIAINLAADAGLLSKELKLHKNTSKRLMNKCTSISLSELYQNSVQKGGGTLAPP